MKLDRRGVLKALTAIPVVGALIAVLSPFFRFLKPNDKPWGIFTITPDLPQGGAQVVGKVSQLAKQVRFVNSEGYVGFDGETDIVLFSRICPHLGCIYNYVSDWHEVSAGYGGFRPPGFEQHALMACPCHFSIYDPEYPDNPGNVISGPAPRGARYFRFEIHGDDIVVTGAEVGAIAQCAPGGAASPREA